MEMESIFLLSLADFTWELSLEVYFMAKDILQNSKEIAGM
jgi:hypothetical protein